MANCPLEIGASPSNPLAVTVVAAGAAAPAFRILAEAEKWFSPLEPEELQAYIIPKSNFYPYA